jgi:ribosomal protein L37AE/L43A
MIFLAFDEVIFVVVTFSHVSQVFKERFSSAASLFKQSGKSHDMKVWKCETCGGGFTGKYILHAHMKKMHNL